ncbi:response regulator [Paenibacillus sp. strain BS8-2]
MYNVLLVDDEELDLEGMKQFIPWSELDMVVKGGVNNALSACELLETQEIDILVSDVNMPYMSGLELARIALQRRPNIRIIFVSGYQEFSYVQQALSLKAYSYVLKPMDDSELVASLMKVKRDLDDERKMREVEEAYKHLIPIAKSDLLIRLFEGEAASLKEYGGKLPVSQDLEQLKWPARVAVMELDAGGALGSDSTLLEMSRMFVRQLHDGIGAIGSHIPYCRMDAKRIALIVEEQRLGEELKQLQLVASKGLNLSITTGLGTAVDGAEGLALSYKQAVEAVEGKMFLGKGITIKFEEAQSKPEMMDARELDIRMAALLQAMSDYNLVLLHDECDNLFRSIASLRSKCTVQNVSGYIIWKLDNYLNARNENLFELLGIELNNLDILMQMDTITDIRAWLIRRLYELSERLHEKASSKDGRFIRNVMATMKERMGENITLKDIALHFSFSPSYLGFLIKEKSGQTFNELLVQLRMERACELLKQPKLKIYEVSDQVGYRYLPYFSRQFKEKFGMTPMEYRKNIL